MKSNQIPKQNYSLWDRKSQHKIAENFFILLGLFVLFRYLTSAEPVVETVAIIVLGGGLTSTGEVPIHTQLRLNKAVDIYKSLKLPSFIITLSGGTTYKPNPLDSNGFPIWESSAAANKLISMGIPAEDVIEENFSLDTIGNAYFLRTVHIDPSNIKELYIITNDWHMPRTKAIFNSVFQLPQTGKQTTKESIQPKLVEYKHENKNSNLRSNPSFTNNNKVNNNKVNNNKLNYKLNFEHVESGIEDKEILDLRIKKEKDSLQYFNKITKNNWNSLSDLHYWLFTKHDAYSSRKFFKNYTKIDQKLLDTY